MGTRTCELVDCEQQWKVPTRSCRGSPSLLRPVTARFITEAVESLQQQHYPFGASYSTLAPPTGRSHCFSDFKTTVLSELDAGSHDAMNRGVSKASGDIIGFLNVDIYIRMASWPVSGIFCSRYNDVVVGAQSCSRTETGRHIASGRAHNKESGLWMPELTFGVPGINGWFFRRRVFERVGNFDNMYSFSADRLFLISIALAGLKSRLLVKPGIYYRRHSGSRTFNREMANLMPISEEHFRMSHELGTRAATHPSSRRVFLAWHAFEGSKLVVRYALAGEIRQAASILGKLFRQNPFWPIRLMHGIALRLAVARLDRGTIQQGMSLP